MNKSPRIAGLAESLRGILPFNISQRAAYGIVVGGGIAIALAVILPMVYFIGIELVYALGLATLVIAAVHFATSKNTADEPPHHQPLPQQEATQQHAPAPIVQQGSPSSHDVTDTPDQSEQSNGNTSADSINLSRPFTSLSVEEFERWLLPILDRRSQDPTSNLPPPIPRDKLNKRTREFLYEGEFAYHDGQRWHVIEEVARGIPLVIWALAGIILAFYAPQWLTIAQWVLWLFVVVILGYGAVDRHLQRMAVTNLRVIYIHGIFNVTAPNNTMRHIINITPTVPFWTRVLNSRIFAWVPGTAGIDCTHLKIRTPEKEEEEAIPPQKRVKNGNQVQRIWAEISDARDSLTRGTAHS